MSKRTILTVVGFLLFILGFVSLIVNLIGLDFAITDWLNPIIGKTACFFVKIMLTLTGIILTIAANGKAEEAYDEYFDGEKYS